MCQLLLTHSLRGPRSNQSRGLAARRSGCPRIGSVAHFAARVIAKHFGLNPDRDLKFIAVGPVDASFARLTQGLVDAALLSPP